MKAIKRLMAKSGTYKDRETGQDKNSYTRCGVLMKNEQGEVSIKLEALPVNFDGWLNCWDLESSQAKQAAAPKMQAQAPQGASFNDFNDEIGF